MFCPSLGTGIVLGSNDAIGVSCCGSATAFVSKGYILFGRLGDEALARRKGCVGVGPLDE